jgi:hypothetical protein
MRSRLVWAPMAALVLLFALAFPVAADNFGAIYEEPTSVSLQDDYFVSWQFSTIIPSRFRSATSWSITGSYNTTDLTFSQYPNGHRDDLNNYYSVSNSMPISGLVAYHDCVYWVSLSRTRCRHGHIVYLNRDWSTDRERTLACHETGHSTGLRHRDSNRPLYRCMTRGVTDPYMGSHNVGHVNANYP